MPESKDIKEPEKKPADKALDPLSGQPVVVDGNTRYYCVSCGYFWSKDGTHPYEHE